MTERDNTGILSRNISKDPQNPEHEKWSDFSGDMMVDGKHYWISAWVRIAEGKEGQTRKYFSLAFKPKKPKKDAEAP